MNNVELMVLLLDRLKEAGCIVDPTQASEIVEKLSKELTAVKDRPRKLSAEQIEELLRGLDTLSCLNQFYKGVLILAPRAPYKLFPD